MYDNQSFAALISQESIRGFVCLIFEGVLDVALRNLEFFSGTMRHLCSSVCDVSPVDAGEEGVFFE